MRATALLLLAAGALGYSPSRMAPASAAGIRRAAAPVAGFFDDIGKIVDYNIKYAGAAMSKLFDDRTARASHILFKCASRPPEYRLPLNN